MDTCRGSTSRAWRTARPTWPSLAPRAVGTHLAVQAAIAIDYHHINHSVLGGNQAIPQHEQTRRLRTDPPTEDDVRNGSIEVVRQAHRSPRRRPQMNADAELDAALGRQAGSPCRGRRRRGWRLALRRHEADMGGCHKNHLPASRLPPRREERRKELIRALAAKI